MSFSQTSLSTFQNLPLNYESLKENINNNVIKSLYSIFQFQYLKIDSKIDELALRDLLLDILKDSKFITYQIKESINPQISINHIGNAIICIEKKCLIIESIKADLFQSILQKTESSIINVDSQDKSPKQIEIDNEISSFYIEFIKYINQNEFVKYSIKPIIAYIIRRNFYPTFYFKDPSFLKKNFYYKKQLIMNLKSMTFIKMILLI